MEQPATLVEGKYEVLAKIREGGMGATYKVRHRLLDEIRVVKVMRPSVAGEAEFRRRFLDEAKTATRLKHPNICTIYDFALDADGVSYLVMEFIDGVTLADLLGAQGPPSVPLCLEITHQTLLALAFLHQRNIVHRDIAPDNLMLTVDENGKSRVKLIDLGIAKLLDRQTSRTSTGAFLGKLDYASPEQFGSLPRGTTIDGRSDLYSMGLVLYQLLTGRKAFTGETPVELMRAHVLHPPAAFAETDPKGLVPKDVRLLVLKAIQKNREDRFASAQEFDQAVVAVLDRMDRRSVDVEGPTLIMGIKTPTPLDGSSVTPGAQGRLDQHFVARDATPMAGPTIGTSNTESAPAVASVRPDSAGPNQLTERPRESRSGRRISPMVVVAVAAVVIAALWYWSPRREAAPTTRETAPTPARAAPTVASPVPVPPEAPGSAAPVLPIVETDVRAAAVPMGDLAVDVLPWGTVERIEDSGGDLQEAGLPRDTPLSLHLPAGKYFLYVSNPNYVGSRLKLPAEVRPGERTLVAERFESIDAKAFFRSEGWPP